MFAAGIPALALAQDLPSVLLGVGLWGAAIGVQDSTVKAYIADLVAVSRRGAAYGIFAAFQGAGTLLGSTLAGWFYPNVTVLLVVTVPAQIAAFVLMRRAIRVEYKKRQ